MEKFKKIVVMRTKVMLMVFAAGLMLAGITSCRNGREEVGRLEIRMADSPSPYNYDAIYLDVVGVEVSVEQECCGTTWTTVRSGSGVYNLLTLVNGVDVILCNEEFPAGHIEQVRLILGDGNTIVVDGVSHPLIVPSGSQTGLKIIVHDELETDERMTLILDFDAAHSINLTGSGTYHLKPVMHGFFIHETGQIHGTITGPPTTGIAVVASGGSKTYTTYCDASTGQFLVRGLPSGTYSVMIYYEDRTARYDGVVVKAGETTELAL